MIAFVNRISLVLLVAACWPQAEASVTITGEARSIESGELRYREIHACSPDGDQCTVEYRTPGGDLFARKELDYSRSRYAPSLLMEDRRDGRVIEVRGGFAGNTVVDAGFDNYVRSRWDQLARGEVLEFPFLVAGRKRPLEMRAQRRERGCPAWGLCIEVGLDSWWLGRLVAPIQLLYDESRRLRQFRGVSNILDREGRRQEVAISYDYVEGPAE